MSRVAAFYAITCRDIGTRGWQKRNKAMTIARHLPTLLQIGSDHAIKSRKGHTVRTRIATAALALSSCLTLASVSAFAAAAALRAWASYATSRHSDSRG